MSVKVRTVIIYSSQSRLQFANDKLLSGKKIAYRLIIHLPLLLNP